MSYFNNYKLIIIKIFHCVMSKIFPSNFNIPKKIFTYFEFQMVVMLRKLEWLYKVFYLLPRGH